MSQISLSGADRAALNSAIQKAKALLVEDQAFGYHNQAHGLEVANSAKKLATDFYGASEDFLRVVYFAGLTHDIVYCGSSNYLKNSGGVHLFPQWVQQLLPLWEDMSFPAEEVSAFISSHLLREAGFGDEEVISRVSNAILMTAVPKSVQLRANLNGADPLAVVLTAADLWESVSNPFHTMEGTLKLFREPDQEAIQKGLKDFWEEHRTNGMTFTALSLLAKSTFAFFGFVVAPDGKWQGGVDFSKAGHPVFTGVAEKTFATLLAIAAYPQDYPEMLQQIEALLVKS